MHVKTSIYVGVWNSVPCILRVSDNYLEHVSWLCLLGMEIRLPIIDMFAPPKVNKLGAKIYS